MDLLTVFFVLFGFLLFIGLMILAARIQQTQIENELALKQKHQEEADHPVSFRIESRYAGYRNTLFYFEVCTGCGREFFTFPTSSDHLGFN